MYLKKMIKTIGLTCFLLLSIAAFAQNKTITGKVIDATGKAVVGATVAVRGQSGGVVTADDGSYAISVPNNATTLVISSVGFTAQEISVAAATTANVTLQSAAGNLSEVVVIGYGTARRKDVTGSVTTVTSRDFQRGTITTPEQLIAGKVAGVQITSNGGQPGSGSRIRVRGGSSLSASNDPLIVIDGVPLENGGIAGGNSPLSFINPNDIESFTVLKDASAAAIYGTRASNGVIIITTKKGRSDKLRINFSTLNSVSRNTKQVEVLTGDQVRSIVSQFGNASQKALVGTANTNWQDQIYQSALASDNNITLTGGLAKVPYRVSLGYLNQAGVLKTDHLNRYSTSIALNPTFLDNHLRVDVNLKATLQKYRFANTGAIGTAVYFDPTQPVMSKSSRYGGYFEFLDASGLPNTFAARNPLAMLYDTDNRSNAKRSIGNVQFDYKMHFLPELRANLNLGYDISKGEGRNIVSDSSSLEYRTAGHNNEYRQKKQNLLMEFYLNYAKDIAAIKSRIDVLGGYSYNNFQTVNYNFASYNARGVKFPNSDPIFQFDRPENTLLSYFGRMNFTLNNKYVLTATVRRDGSSRFAPANRWGTFPSFAFAWRTKDEDFLRSSNTISDLKVRLGYGVTGQQEGIGNYDYLSYYSLSTPSATYQFGDTYFQMYRPGGFYANRKWEETSTYNAALDYGFFGNRITGSLDFYVKKTTDLLNSIPAPAGTNFSAYVLANVGSMENKGVEFSINATPVKNRDFTWDVSYNVTYNKNTITGLTVIPDDPNYLGFPTGGLAGTGGFAFINSVGFSRATYYLYRQIYDKTGRPIEGLFEDINRDGVINEQDKVKSKRADPNVFMGFSTNASYKNWSAGFVMRASFNNYIYNNVYSNNGRLNQVLGQVTGNASVNYLESGIVGNSDQQILSDYYLQNASFLRMDNFNIGYNFGRVVRSKAGLRANFTVQNVFVVTKYTGLDPEVGGGIDNNIYPRPRIYSLGLNLDF